VLAGGVQSLTEGLEEAAKGPRIYDTDVIDSNGFSSSTSSTAFPEYHTQKGTAEWVSTSSSSTSSTLEELERQSKERSGRYVRPSVVLSLCQSVSVSHCLIVCVSPCLSLCVSAYLSLPMSPTLSVVPSFLSLLFQLLTFSYFLSLATD
jgi:hypothetical protein